MRIAQVLGQIVFVGVLVWLFPGSMQAAAESQASGTDLIGQAEQTLKGAAAGSPQWHRRQDSIHRDVHDIMFLLEQAWRAGEKANDAEREDYAQQALTLLERAVAHGHFDPTKAEPVNALIRRLLSRPAS